MPERTEGAAGLPAEVLREHRDRAAEGRLNLRNFWYVAAESHELQATEPLARTILGETLVLFRGADGKPTAFPDKCLHRAGKLSKGWVVDGCLQCPYHGWVYDAKGSLCEIPSMGPQGRDAAALGSRKTRAYEAREQQGFVYVRLETPHEDSSIQPFSMLHYGEKNWRHLRLQNRFKNNVVNCAENFIDIPHTAFVHPGIFRTSRRQKLSATVTRKGGSVITKYQGETDNLGWFSWLLNPSGKPIGHIDSFHMPNVTCVEYEFGPHRRFVITSQSVPVAPDETLTYTDLSWDYGWLSPFAGPIVRWQGQKVIDQDLDVLADQMDVIKKHGAKFSHSPADVIHVLVESVCDELAKGRDPRNLPDRTQEVDFWV
jgi:phenylpropionate dioxygenase-like ring-hydroxylating dioxygenase large terminal subunit